MTTTTDTMTDRDPTPIARGDALSAFCHTLFASLPRIDQRRWAEYYVRGMVELDGRKSVRRIAEEIVGQPAEQCLQQFVNQSPWNWRPVRAELTRLTASALPLRAWVIDDVVFPKSGTGSVGVHRQFAYSAGRTLNCQVGVALSLASEAGSCPVDWRLTIPSTWSGDDRRRVRCRVPPDEVARPWSQYVGELLDGLPDLWPTAHAPVLLDGRREQGVDALLETLERRGLPYMVRVAPSTALPAGSMLTEVGHASPSSTEPHLVGHLATLAAREGRTTVWWRSVDGRPTRSQTAVVSVPHRPGAPTGPRAITATHRGGGARRTSRSRRLVVEWRADERLPHALWLTTLPPTHPSELLTLTSLSHSTRRELDRMEDDCGLQHFEGRSYRGWHHHVTLASAAHAYRRLQQSPLAAGARTMGPLA